MLGWYTYQTIEWTCLFHVVAVAKKFKTTLCTVTCVMTTFVQISVTWIDTTNNGRSFDTVILFIGPKLENLQIVVECISCIKAINCVLIRGIVRSNNPNFRSPVYSPVIEVYSESMWWVNIITSLHPFNVSAFAAYSFISSKAKSSKAKLNFKNNLDTVHLKFIYSKGMVTHIALEFLFSWVAR